MKTTTRLWVAIMVTVTLYSCGERRNQSTVGNETDLLENELKNIGPKAKGGNTCLLAYAEKYDKLLTQDMVAGATGVEADGMSFEFQQIAKRTKYHDVTYSWKGSLTRTVGGMTFPMNDYVKLTGIEPVSLNQFQVSYRAVSEEETVAIVNSTDEALAGKSNNKAVNEGLEKLKEMGMSEEDIKKTTEGFAGSAQKMTEGFTKVDKLGDVATWNAKTNTLYVFKDGAMFELVVELSNSNRNREVAIHLARQILVKCE